jgi:hypothetical protein
LLEDILYIINCVFTACDVKSAVSKLKRAKSDVNSVLTSDHLISAGEELFVHIALLLTSLNIHGFVPKSFAKCTIRPIPKGHNQNLSESANYRGIAISSLFGKIIDHIVLHRYCHLLASNELQFGFKQGYSTQLCSMVLKETISYYTHNRSSVYCTFLDATKAFDRVNYCKLFTKLIDRHLPPFILRLLINCYVDNVMQVSWLGFTSASFVALNGVKQGGVLSPVLFCVYVDDLLLKLSRAGVGCYTGDIYTGALAYADDIVLVAPTATAMRKMLAICDSFAADSHLSFNAAKSKCLLIGSTRKRGNFAHSARSSGCLSFQIMGKDIDFVESFKHLGHVINSDFDDADDIEDKRAVFIGQANNVLCYFRKLTANVKQVLFNYYCLSLFGSSLWRLDHGLIETVCIAWRQAIRRIWSLPRTARSDLLPLLSRSLPIREEICHRSLTFILQCISHKSPLIRRLAVNSILSENFAYWTQSNLLCPSLQVFSERLSDREGRADMRQAFL